MTVIQSLPTKHAKYANEQKDSVQDKLSLKLSLVCLVDYFFS
jgi:hypothetical protein